MQVNGQDEKWQDKADYQSLLEQIPTGIVVTDGVGLVLYVNAACERMFNRKRESLVGQLLGLPLELGKRTEVDIFRVGKDSGLAIMETLEAEWMGSRAILVYFHDVTERREAETKVEQLQSEFEGRVLERTTSLMEEKSQISYLSYHDVLTGLYNRRFYEEEIRRLNTSRNHPLSFVMGDVNGLKLMNDAFGHAKGDEFLRKAAGVIREACRTDDIIARWGGDEFVILLPGTDSGEAADIVRRIRDSAAREHVNGIPLSISFGWETKVSLDEDVEKILKSAEDHMYRQKVLENKGLRGNIIKTIIQAIHEKSPREEDHSRRVSDVAQQIAISLHLSEHDTLRVRTLGLLHDIGKIAISEGLLDKSGDLTAAEWDELQQHPVVGYRIVNSSQELADFSDAILSHHERWDGKGYPRGLKGEDIPLLSRIVTLADAFVAMTSERPYRTRPDEEMCLEEFRKNAGTQFDPNLVSVFMEKVFNELWRRNRMG